MLDFQGFSHQSHFTAKLFGMTTVVYIMQLEVMPYYWLVSLNQHINSHLMAALFHCNLLPNVA
jgi:hypothetical protein